MKAMRTPVLILALAAAPLMGRAQEASPSPAPSPRETPPTAKQQAAMARLDSMVGLWEGEGWIDIGGRRPFRGSERVQRKLGGLALLVEGDFVGRTPASGDKDVPVHTTLAIISFDPKTEKYRFSTWLGHGGSGEHELTVNPDGWQWHLQAPRGVVRFITKLTPEGQWLETGERTIDGQTWNKFFEMSLRKKP